jgi:hypothetical protein
MRLRIKNRTWCLVLLAVCSTVWFTASTTFATTTIQANICQASFTGPAITDPQSDTQTSDSSIIVKGTGEPNMGVTILENGVSVGTATILPDGTYALEVPLAVGDNILVAREATSCTTIDSTTITVHRPTPPQPPKPSPSSPSSPAKPPASHNPSVGILPIGNGSTPSAPAQPASPGSEFFTPTITYPTKNQQFTTAHTWVTGRAQPGSLVVIYVNGAEAARVIASDSGTYGAMVSLTSGKNMIYVRSELNGKSMTSNVVSVEFNPQTPIVRIDHSWCLYLILLLLLLLLFLYLLWRAHRRHQKEGA